MRLLIARGLTNKLHLETSTRPGSCTTNLWSFSETVLGLVVANYLCNSYPGGTEGELSRMKHRLVSAPTLAKASVALKLGDFLRFGRGEEKSGGRQKNALLADVFEAITGAIFMDGGMEAATLFVSMLSGRASADPLALRWRTTRPCSGKTTGSTSTSTAIYCDRNPGPSTSTDLSCRSFLGRWQHTGRGTFHQSSRSSGGASCTGRHET